MSDIGGAKSDNRYDRMTAPGGDKRVAWVSAWRATASCKLSDNGTHRLTLRLTLAPSRAVRLDPLGEQMLAEFMGRGRRRGAGQFPRGGCPGFWIPMVAHGYASVLLGYFPSFLASRGGLPSRTPLPPPFSAMRVTPAFSSAASMAARLFVTGVLVPLSNPLIVDRPTLAASASCFCVQSRRPRAARQVAGFNILGKCRTFSPRSNKKVAQP